MLGAEDNQDFLACCDRPFLSLILRTLAPKAIRSGFFFMGCDYKAMNIGKSRAGRQWR